MNEALDKIAKVLERAQYAKAAAQVFAFGMGAAFGAVTFYAGYLAK